MAERIFKDFHYISHALFTTVPLLLLKGVSHSTDRYKALNYWRIFSSEVPPQYRRRRPDSSLFPMPASHFLDVQYSFEMSQSHRRLSFPLRGSSYSNGCIWHLLLKFVPKKSNNNNVVVCSAFSFNYVWSHVDAAKCKPHYHISRKKGIHFSRSFLFLVKYNKSVSSSSSSPSYFSSSDSELERGWNALIWHHGTNFGHDRSWGPKLTRLAAAAKVQAVKWHKKIWSPGTLTSRWSFLILKYLCLLFSLLSML